MPIPWLIPYQSFLFKPEKFPYYCKASFYSEWHHTFPNCVQKWRFVREYLTRVSSADSCVEENLGTARTPYPSGKQQPVGLLDSVWSPTCWDVPSWVCQMRRESVSWAAWGALPGTFCLLLLFQLTGLHLHVVLHQSSQQEARFFLTECGEVWATLQDRSVERKPTQCQLWASSCCLFLPLRMWLPTPSRQGLRTVSWWGPGSGLIYLKKCAGTSLHRLVKNLWKLMATFSEILQAEC